MYENSPLFLIVDLFCGAGGTTTGFSQAEIEGNSIAKVIACVNHDPKAIISHWKNHPEVKHFEEDIRTLDLTELKQIVKWWQERYPDAYLVLWASLECTNFSKAKGGQPRDPDSRTLAEHLDRYIEAINPDYVQIENVVEFMSWGPLDEKGKPVSKKSGADWLRWRGEICEYGYYDDWAELNSANFGAYTSRNRLFGCFAKHGLPIVWPKPTHAKNPVKDSLFNSTLQKWKAVKEVLDFTDEGKSIFNREKALSDKTLERIYAGLVKYVANGDSFFISKYYSGRPAGKNISVNNPAGTITCIDGQALVQANFLLKYNSMSEKGVHTPPSVNDPCPVIAAQPRLGIIQPQFLAAYYGNGDNCTSVDKPCPVIPTKDRFQLVSPEFASAQNQSINRPEGSILTNDKHNLVKAVPFIMPTSYDNKPKSVEDSCPTIQASRRHHYLVNPSWGGNNGSVEGPCCVIVARQDKAPLYLIQAEEGAYSVPIYEDDTEPMRRIKAFMAAFGLVDIKMRMLRVLELLQIQGFPMDYHLHGNQSDQKKFIGNSVVPRVIKAWCEAMGHEIIRRIKKVA